MPTRKILEGVREFKKEIYPTHERLFRDLEAGQAPEVLMITCSDSRVDPSLLTRTLPGELFVLRNAGNLVGPYDGKGDAQSGTIEYAVKALEVEHIVVCGHSGCGAMAAVLDPASVAELPAVAAWLETAGAERAPGADPSLADQVRFNVTTQLDRLRTHPSVRKAEEAGKLSLHGWVYDFVNGEVTALCPANGEFVKINTAGGSAATA